MGNIFYLLFLGFIWLAPPVLTKEGVTLTIQLRATDGAPLVGEPVILEQLPDAAALDPQCQTDPEGLCTWLVAPGLYQVRFPAYTLDNLSALALAEGGLSGLGITVGESTIRYGFTVQADGHVYFDATPDAAAPTPRHPAETDLSGGVVISPVVGLVTKPQITITPVSLLPEPEEATPSIAWWMWLGGGVTLGFTSWFSWRYWPETLNPLTGRRKKS